MASYSDTQLIQFVIKAARRINRILELTDTPDEIVIDSSTGEMSSPNDEDLKDILELQAECLIAQSDFQRDLNSGVAGVLVRDGEQTLDTRDAADSRKNFYDSNHSPCAQLEKQLVFERLRRGGGMKDIW